MADEHDDLIDLMQPAFVADASGLARRCALALRRNGISRAPEDWLILEHAGERHCWAVLDDIATAEKLTAVQVAKVRLALRGQSCLPTYEESNSAMAQPYLKLPLWRVFRKYTLLNPLEIGFVFTNRPAWYRAVFDALDDERLMQTLSGSSEIFLVVGALLMGGEVTLISYDLTRSHAYASPLHIICLSVNVLAFMFSFCAVLFQLYTLHIYMPVHRNNLRDVVRSTRMLPMTGGLCFALGAWGIFLGLLCEAMRPLEGLDFWLFREQDLHSAYRAVPALTITFCFSVLTVLFFVQISATARVVAHSGAFHERQVLPAEAASWSAGKAKRALTAVALSNPDLETLYASGGGGLNGAAAAAAHSRRKMKPLLALRNRIGM